MTNATAPADRRRLRRLGTAVAALVVAALATGLPTSHATDGAGVEGHGVGVAPEPTMRALADRVGLRFGAAAQASQLDDADYLTLVEDWANTLTFENDTKFGPIQPQPGVWDFTRADTVADFAVEHGMQMRGHVLIWHQQNPGWLLELEPTRDEALALMRDHIDAVVGHFATEYPGVVVHWDVVNEAFEPDGTLRDTIWRRWIGDDYIAHAFRFARAAAGPDVDLYYNDFFDGISLLVESGGLPLQEAAAGRNPAEDRVPPVGNGAHGPMTCDLVPRCVAVRTLVDDLLADGVPIDGVGFQAHQANPVRSDYRGLTGWVGERGLSWALTEVDVPMPEDRTGSGVGRAHHQPQGFTTPLQACLDDPACDTYITWGVSDRYTWFNDFMYGLVPDALPYDANLEPKPAVAAIRSVLESAASTTGG